MSGSGLPAPAHPDLNAMLAPQVQSGSQSTPSGSSTTPGVPSQSSQPIPQNPMALLQFMRDNSRSLASVKDVLIPMLDRIEAGEGQSGTEEERRKKGEELICLPGILEHFSVTDLPDEEIKLLSAALMYINSARFVNPPGDKEWDQLMVIWSLKFAKTANYDQIRLTKGKIGTFAWGLQMTAKRMGRPPLCIMTLMGLHLESFPGSKFSVFSGIQPAVLEACLLEREYDVARAFIAADFTDFSTAQPTYLDVITFYHHAGLICATLGEYHRAKDMFTIAICVPTLAASAIQLACAKRAILCELIISGKAPRWPKYMSSQVSRLIEKNATEYTQFAKAFEAQDWATVIAAKRKKDFEQDSNLGLLQQVLGSVMKRKILKIKETYSRLRLNELAERVDDKMAGAAETSAALQNMIASGELKATITPDAQSPIVAFLDDQLPPPADTAGQIKEMEEKEALLERYLEGMTKEMGIDPEYLKKQVDMQGGGQGEGSSGRGQAGTVGGSGFKGRGVGWNQSDMGF